MNCATKPRRVSNSRGRIAENDPFRQFTDSEVSVTVDRRQ